MSRFRCDGLQVPCRRRRLPCRHGKFLILDFIKLRHIFGFWGFSMQRHTSFAVSWLHALPYIGDNEAPTSPRSCILVHPEGFLPVAWSAIPNRLPRRPVVSPLWPYRSRRAHSASSRSRGRGRARDQNYRGKWWSFLGWLSFILGPFRFRMHVMSQSACILQTCTQFLSGKKRKIDDHVERENFFAPILIVQ
jgi:hypothetical protein